MRSLCGVGLSSNGHPLSDLKLEHDACGTGLLVAKTEVASRDLLARGVEALGRMAHRGGDLANACSDGSGVLFEIPWSLFESPIEAAGRAGELIVGSYFLSHIEDERERQLDLIREVAGLNQLEIATVRTVPFCPEVLPLQSREKCPVPVQVVLRRMSGQGGAWDVHTTGSLRFSFLEATLDNDFRSRFCRQRPLFTSFSHRTVVYKGLVNGRQLSAFYPDLRRVDLPTRFVLFHQRFATNTNPDWELVQPFENLAHNGEINTIRSNAERLLLRMGSLMSDSVISGCPGPRTWFAAGQSDSRIMNLALQLMMYRGMPVDVAVSSLIAPLGSEADASLSNCSVSPQDLTMGVPERQRSLFEVWDGPAALVFTDGENVGAALDRNGLRPLRLIEDDAVTGIASELGVFDFANPAACRSRRIRAGEIVFFPAGAYESLSSQGIRTRIETEVDRLSEPFEWPRLRGSRELEDEDLADLLIQPCGYFGFFKESVGRLYSDVIESASEPVSSMGNDGGLAPLVPASRTLFDYFRQRFAQVTNPPIDPVRERCLFDMTSHFGAGAVAQEGQVALRHRRMALSSPLLLPRDIAELKEVLVTHTLDLCYPANLGRNAKVSLLCERLERCLEQIEEQTGAVVIEDGNAGSESAAFPVLLVAGALHSRLVELGARQRLALIVRSSQIRSSHDVACLLALGVDALCPQGLYAYCAQQAPAELGPKQAVLHARQALEQGLRKVMSRSGITQLTSFKASYAMDVIGLSHDLCRNWLGMVRGRYGRMGLPEVVREQDELMEQNRLLEETARGRRVSRPSVARWSSWSSMRSYNPDTIAALRTAVLRDSEIDYKRYSRLMVEQDQRGLTLRGLLGLKEAAIPLPMNQVEPAQSVLERLSIGAMSIGALSPEAHITLARAARALGVRSNSGEGGEGAECPSAIRQVASGRFGVDLTFLREAKEIQIKIAQGAKPGEGGQIPGSKVTVEIATLRHTSPGVGLISPPPHHDIYSIEDLKQLIFDLRQVNPQARIGVKLVSTCGVGTIAVGVAKAGADTITISGHDGGTGAASYHSIYHVGDPWEVGLIEAHDELNANGLRHQVRLVVDGQIRCGRDIILANILGADECSLATAPLVSMGCMLMRKCHSNTCPVGIATQNPTLRERFPGESQHVERFFSFLAQEVREELSRLGVSSLAVLRGQRHYLTIDGSKLLAHWKTRRIDVRQLLFATMTPYSKPKVKLLEEADTNKTEREIVDALVQRLAQSQTSSLFFEARLSNRDMTFGARISWALAEHGPGFMGRIRLGCTGTAGQSFGSFLSEKVDLILEGAANDGVGKGLSGGTIIIRSPYEASKEQPQSLAGNSCFYGATRGRGYIAGTAGDRFAVRNSGATLIVDGLGDHGCEYMTGGIIFILGEFGHNLGAGMSGGEIFLFGNEDPLHEEVFRKLSPDVVLMPVLSPEHIQKAMRFVSDHVALAQSARAREILENWELYAPRLCKVLPRNQATHEQLYARGGARSVSARAKPATLIPTAARSVQPPVRGDVTP